METILDFPGITQALTNGCRLRAFTSGGGLRVVRIEQGNALKGYGEHPNIEEALAHADEDYVAGGRPYKEVYGVSYPHYLTGTTTASSALDEWLLKGHKMAAWFEDGLIVCEVRGFEHVRFPQHLREQVLRTGQPATWEHRGYTYSLERSAVGGPEAVSGRVIGSPEGKTSEGADPWMPEVSGVGRAATLLEAAQVALADAAADMIA